MKQVFLKFALIALLLSSIASAQTTITLENFNSGSTVGAVDTATSWNNQITQSATTITVGGSAKDDSGWTYTFTPTPVDLSAFSYVVITAQRDSGNLATSLSLTLADDNGSDFTTVTFNTSLFAVGSLTTVSMPITWTGTGQQIASWNFGGGQPSPGSAAFRMTFDNLSLSTTPAVPEPSTYAQIALGLGALGFIAYRRRKVA